MRQKIFKQLLIFFLIFSGILFFRLVLAQSFGTNEVDVGLDGSLVAGSDPRTIVGRIINIVLGFLGVIALGLIIYAGFLWMTSSGNEEKIVKAKKTLINATIGLIIILASWGIATFLVDRLSGSVSGGPDNGICIDGESIPCGCGGVMYCVDSNWGACIGSDCSSGNPSGPSSCDASSNPGCQANDNICASGYYCDDSECICKPQGSIGDPCDGNPETDICEANDNLCGEFLLCDQQTCTCFGPPIITGISPAGGFCEEDIDKSCQSDLDCELGCNRNIPNGASNNLITIFGNSFGEYQAGLSQVVFSNNNLGRDPRTINPLCVDFWSNEQIIIAVPEEVVNGPIKVIRADGSEDTTNNEYGPQLPDFIVNSIVRPGLCTISPESGPLGTEFSYQGISLYSAKAYFGNYDNNIQALRSDFSHPAGLSGQAEIPNIRSGEVDSFVISQIGANQESSNYVRVIKEASPEEGPFITSFSPQTGRAGQYVTINGSDFEGAQGNSHVYFGESEAVYDFPAICASSVWNNNQIIVKVPENIANGDYFITIDIDSKTIDTSQLNPNIFTVNDSLSLKTSLCKLEPEQGTIGTEVKLYGEYFGELGREGLVNFYKDKNISGTINKENEADIISVPVPVGAITGPVKVIKNNQWGNELNFSVLSCQSNDDCPGQVCCPENTYKKGRCENSLSNCLIDIPASVFEWNFDTGYSSPENTDPTETCNTLADYLGACQTDVSCPNVPGVCSPYAGGVKQVVAECDYSCASVAGCGGGLGSSTCTYDENLNRCIKNGNSGLCSLDKKEIFNIAGQNYELTLTCNAEGNWQTITNTSCPDGFERGVSNICVDKNSSCDLCDEGLSCYKVGTEGRCVSNLICPTGSVCEDDPDVGSSDNCIAFDESSCDCCCRIDKSAQDCCIPLECTGTCGNDTTDDGVGLGVCSGCALAGDTQAERDAACNCVGHSGQYCDTSINPNGICQDCTNLGDKESCNEHNTVCCFDARQTVSENDDICRGGDGQTISDNPSHPDFGYCAYYNCDSEDSSLCATTTPAKLGLFKNIDDCNAGAAQGECDICSLYDGKKDECAQISTCCFDYETNKCQDGEKIDSGENNGYCAYYNCGDPNTDPPQNPNICITEPQLSGEFSDFVTCDMRCGSNDGGAGKDCISQTTASVCNFDVCNYPDMACLTEGGDKATDVSDCGICCCNPNQENACQTENSPDLYCQPNVGSCTGKDRGLCCGCSQDQDCGNKNTIGCGFDSCCRARPEVISSIPKSGEENICRNAVIEVTFDSQMDLTSFNNNVLLLQEMDYGSGVCPTGTFVYGQNQEKDNNKLAKFWHNLKMNFKNLFSKILASDQTLAKMPEDDKLYCAASVNFSAENTDKETIATFAPQKLLAPNTDYFLIIKGDEELNSQTGVTNAEGIALNGQGLESEDGFIEGENLKFNNNFYKNSHIVYFKTLADSKYNSGVCAVSKVDLRPFSYLFNTTENSLDENDESSQHKSFDTEHDRDKVFSGLAYSADGQTIQPVTGYFWDWNFDILDSSVAEIKDISDLKANKAFISAKTGVSDAETKLKVTIDMTRFLGEGANSNPDCECLDEVCSNNCLNTFSAGDTLTDNSDIYIFVCNNPWPPIESDGSWSPWSDNCEAAIGPCTNFNYKFYYCRDAGEPGTFDDLPAISDKAVIRGESAILTCSLDNTPCENLNTACGTDRNGDGQPDGICIWSVLKESYFFREQVLPPGEISDAIDTKVGNEIILNWHSSSNQVKSYKIYYGQEGRAISSVHEVLLKDNACEKIGEEYVCQYKISNLENNKKYVFRLSVISENSTESILSNERTATPTDRTPPLIPVDFSMEEIIINEGEEDEEKYLRFSWQKNDDDALFYRLYRGINRNLYGESFDSDDYASTISINQNILNSANNYFALSAVDTYHNESEKTEELEFLVE